MVRPGNTSDSSNAEIFFREVLAVFGQKLFEKGIKTEEIIAEDLGMVHPDPKRRLQARHLLRSPKRG